jgi:hypothetical protein
VRILFSRWHLGDRIKQVTNRGGGAEDLIRSRGHKWTTCSVHILAGEEHVGAAPALVPTETERVEAEELWDVPCFVTRRVDGGK